MVACATQPPLQEKTVLKPSIVTTAGGAWVTIEHIPFHLHHPEVRIGLRDKQNREVIAWFESEEVEMMDRDTLRFKAPTMIEEAVDVEIRDGERMKILPHALLYHTLAYTANQVGQDISVIDTVTNDLFSVEQSIGFSQPVVPMGMAYSLKSGEEGRKLYVVDAYSGNLRIMDAANFLNLRTITLQRPYAPYPADPLPEYGAIDVVSSYDGTYAYVAHMTYGGPRWYNISPWNPIGSISVVKMVDKPGSPACADGGTPPCLIDLDGDSATTTGGAPDGITRIEPPADSHFIILSAEDVYVPKPSQDDYNVGDRYPGEYLFLSGVGPEDWTIIPPNHCQVGQICPPIRISQPRPVEVGVVDLNPSIVESITKENGVRVLNLTPNPDYQKFVSLVQIGSEGHYYMDQGLSLNPVSTFGEIRIYAVNPNENKAVELQFFPDFISDPNNDALQVIDPPIPTGPDPTDVKVQFVDPFTYAYITNAGDDTVTVVDTAWDQSIGDPISLDQECVDLDHYPSEWLLDLPLLEFSCVEWSEQIGSAC